MLHLGATTCEKCQHKMCDQKTCLKQCSKLEKKCSKHLFFCFAFVFDTFCPLTFRKFTNSAQHSGSELDNLCNQILQQLLCQFSYVRWLHVVGALRCFFNDNLMCLRTLIRVVEFKSEFASNKYKRSLRRELSENCVRFLFNKSALDNK